MSGSPTTRSPKDLPDFDGLAPLESVSPDAFRSSDKDTQEVCNFVLALALAYNDFKDLIWGSNHLSDYAPKPPEITHAHGQWSGMKNHVHRLLYSLVLEVLQLIRENPKPQRHQLFKKALVGMSAEKRKHWNSLYEFAHETSRDELMKMLLQVRNGMASHYKDTKFIGHGYEKFFSEKGQERERAYVSRGNTLRDTRFYFADAAAQGGVECLVKGQEKELAGKLLQRLDNIAMAIFHLICRFIEVRGFAWRKE